jgi:hypothetical protein
MSIVGTDKIIVDRSGFNYKAEAQQLLHPYNVKQNTTGNTFLDHKVHSQYWFLSGDTTITGTSLPPTGFTAKIYIYVETNGYILNFPQNWDITGIWSSTLEWHIVVLEMARYSPDNTTKISGYIISEKTLQHVELVNNLTSTDISKALTAAQGKELKDLIDNVDECPRLLLRYGEYAFSALPASPTTGELAIINDANDLAYRGDAAGGGTATALVLYDGTKWIYH